MQGINLPLRKLIMPTINILLVLHHSSFKVSFIHLIKKGRRMEKLNEYLSSMKLDLIFSQLNL